MPPRVRPDVRRRYGYDNERSGLCREIYLIIVKAGGEIYSPPFRCHLLLLQLSLRPLCHCYASKLTPTASAATMHIPQPWGKRAVLHRLD
jgi:hypothetical protein